MTRDQASLPRRVAGSAMTLAMRRMIIIAMTAVSTAVVAQTLGPEDFGTLSFATALFLLATTAGDFGFSMVIGRDMAQDPAAGGALLRSAVRLQVAWCGAITVILIGIALVLGFDDPRGQLILILAPAMFLSGWGPARAVFLVLYRTKQLAAIDLTVNLLQVSAMAAIALAGGGAAGVAAALSAGTGVNVLLVARAAKAHVPTSGRPSRGEMRRMIKLAAPLGLMSLMSRVYLSIDLVILGALATAAEVGQYAASVKLYALLVTIPGFITQAALPGLAQLAHDRDRLNDLLGRLWHWLMVTAMPACIALAIFARPAVDIAFGQDFGEAVPLVRILCLAAAVALLGGVMGMVLVARGVVYAQLTQNSIAIAVNVGGLLVLVPNYGVQPAAWLTLASEVIVTTGSLVLLRHVVRFRTLWRVSWLPIVAVVAAASTSLLLPSPLIALLGGAIVFGVSLIATRAWPADLAPSRSGRLARAR